MSTREIIRITDDSTRCDIEQAIAAMRTKQDRMPAHWHERRAKVGKRIDEMVDMWLAAGA